MSVEMIPITDDLFDRRPRATVRAYQQYPRGRHLHEAELLKLYRREVARYPVPTPDEQCALAQQVQAGNVTARSRMIQGNLRLVIWLLRPYLHRGVGLLELIQEGNLALIRAVDGFDPSYGTRFSSYAKPAITRAMRAAIGSSPPTIEALDALPDDTSAPELADNSLIGLSPESRAMFRVELERSLWKPMWLLAKAGRQSIARMEAIIVRYGLDGNWQFHSLDRVGKWFEPPICRERVRQHETQALELFFPELPSHRHRQRAWQRLIDRLVSLMEAGGVTCSLQWTKSRMQCCVTNIETGETRTFSQRIGLTNRRWGRIVTARVK